MKNLRTDCVDLIYLHHCNFGKQEQYFDDALEVGFVDFKKMGKHVLLAFLIGFQTKS
ncbi:MAG: hypothetical protein Ct9H300mP29_1550 [Candidatus Neomarinimicrobiota bacterium]|nr:MAG: hypothetical protein Ct9H300mP29_1550 [Candidatus Neomarinimicrobiota bacterium]